MGASKKEGACSPSIKINGHTVAIDKDAASSWNAYEYLKVLSSAEKADEKFDAALGLACVVTGLDKDGIVELAGGGTAQVEEVVKVVSQIITEALPKN